jgi:dihydrofolate reductase
MIWPMRQRIEALNKCVAVHRDAGVATGCCRVAVSREDCGRGSECEAVGHISGRVGVRINRGRADERGGGRRRAPVAAGVAEVGLASSGDDTVRKLKLEMQVSLDGFALDVDGKTDWMLWNWGEDWNWDKALRRRHIDLTTSSDCILLSRMMAEEDFPGHWANVDPADPRSAFAQPITKMRKVVFSKTLDQSRWPNTDLAKGDLADEVNRLKAEQGKDIIVYGGPSFAGSLLRAGLIDELHLFVNPVALGAGRSMFTAIDGALNLTPENATTYECGVVVLQYSLDRDPMSRLQPA